MCGVTGAHVLRCYAIGLRLCGWRPGEAWSAVSQPLCEERETADNMEGLCARNRRRRPMGRGGERTGDELAERASVFLVDARTARRPMVFDVGTRRSRDGIARRLSVNDADDARQNRLRERGEEDPATNKSRNASTHSVVSCGREARKKLNSILASVQRAANWHIKILTAS